MAKLFALLPFVQIQASDTWQVLPIFGGGYVQNVLIAPSATNVWYTYVDVGGPYRSDDAGRHWRPLHGNFSLADRDRNADHVRSLSVDPRNADNIVLVGGNSFDNPGGIYISNDGGKSFQCRQTARFYGNGQRRMYGRCLARNPRRPDELIAGEDFDGLFRSEDNGLTWTSIGLKGCWFTDIRYDCVVANRVYASAPAISDTPAVNCGLRRVAGFWRSDDAGATWTKLSDSAPLEIVQRGASEELLGVFAPKASQVRISRDGGASWSDFCEGLPSDDPSKPFYFSGFYALASTRDVWFAGHAEGDIFVRRPQDASWRKVLRESLAFGNPTCEGHLSRLLASKRFEALGSLTIDSQNVRHWLATDWYFIWESFDAGRNWTARVDGMMQLVSFVMAFDPFDADKIHYGVADMGYFRSLDGGKTFVRPQGDIPYALSFAHSVRTPGFVAAAGGKELGVLFLSFDGGKTWRGIPSGGGLPISPSPRRGTYAVAIDPLTDDVLATVGGPMRTGEGGVYRSQDQGKTWTRFSAGLPDDVELFKNSEFEDGAGGGIAFSPDGSCVLSARKAGTIWSLDRMAGVWRKIDVPQTDGTVAPDPFERGRFLLCGKMMQESTDGGLTFHACPNLPDGFWSVAFDAHTPGLVILGRHDGLWVSRDGGRTARLWPQGLDYPSGSDRRVFVDRRRVFAFSSGSGVWTRTLDSEPDDSIVPLGEANCPDPFVTYDRTRDCYYLLFTQGKHIDIFRSRDKKRLLSDGDMKRVWCVGTNIYGTVWAPEMHKADNGKWYVYSSGDVNPDPNVQDLKLFVLESRTDDPFAGFDFKSIPETRFTAIDPTVWMGGDGNFYMAYSFCKSVPGQDLGVRRMKTPWSFEGEHVCISSPDLPWENSARRRDPINEGPSVFTVGGRTFLAYSANGCWDDEYSVGLLELTSDDPMSANGWKKHSSPILKTGGGLFGPGHATFFKDRDGALWCSHHAMTKSNPSRTPTIRKAFVRPFSSDWLPLDHNGPL